MRDIKSSVYYFIKLKQKKNNRNFIHLLLFKYKNERVVLVSRYFC
jgi:hypothetical protein